MSQLNAQSNSSEAKEKVARLRGLLDARNGKGIALGNIIAIFREDYIEPVFDGLEWKELDLEAVSLSIDIIEGVTSNSMRIMANGISSIGDMMISGDSEGGGRLPEDICPGVGELLDELGHLLAETNKIEYEITLGLAFRLKEELRKHEQYVEIPISMETIKT